jgi:hypothetical protein
MGGNNRPQEHKMITPITLDLIKKLLNCSFIL